MYIFFGAPTLASNDTGAKTDSTRSSSVRMTITAIKDRIWIGKALKIFYGLPWCGTCTRTHIHRTHIHAIVTMTLHSIIDINNINARFVALPSTQPDDVALYFCQFLFLTLYQYLSPKSMTYQTDVFESDCNSLSFNKTIYWLKIYRSVFLFLH